ncbi:MAG: hypothetical protein KKB29_00065 [Nanoarchaeota archaeon]|nr:hypothetical protein [Nanoarchaeota archaeon]
MAKPEKFLIENFSLRDVLDKTFMGEINKLGYNVSPVNLVLIAEKEEAGQKNAFPIVLSHQNNIEVKKKIAHIDSPKSELLEEVIKILEKGNGK